MKRFTYSAHNDKGEVVNDAISAIDRDDAVQRLARLDLIVTRIEEERDGTGQKRGVVVPISELSAFAYEMSVVLEAGIALPNALESYAMSGGDTAFMRELREITEEVRAGDPLSTCLERRPATFPVIFPSLVRTGEEGGGLATSLGQLSRHFERLQELRNTVVQTASYPLIVAVMAFFVIFGLVIFVVPRFASIYEQLEVPIPLPTQVFLTLGKYSSVVLGATVLLAVVAVVIWQTVLRSAAGELAIDRLLLSLGPIGSVTRDVALATFCQTLSILYERGVKIHDAVSLAADACGNRVLATRLARLSESVRAGTPLSDAMGDDKLIELRYLGMIRAGESAGEIGKMLKKVAELMSTRAEIRTKRMLALLEPAMILGIALTVGGVIIALAAPILNLQASIS